MPVGVSAFRHATRWGTRAAAGLVLAGGTFLALPLGSASASSSASTQCGYGSSGRNTYTCLVVGSNVVIVGARNISSGSVLESCLHRNGGRIFCTGYAYVPAGGGIGNSWIPGGSIPGGTYCAVTWRKNSNGSTTEIASECMGVGTTTVG